MVKSMAEWRLIRQGADYEALSREYGVNPVVLRIMRNRGITEAEQIEEYLVQLIMATRHPDKYDNKLAGFVQFGASPRATIALDKCAKINAWLDNRDFVTPEDIHAVIYDVLRHRIILTFEAQAEGVTTDEVIGTLLKIVPLP